MLAACLALSLAAALGLKNLTFSNDYRAFFESDDAQLLALERLQSSFGRDDSLLFVAKPDHGDVFSRGTLAAIALLSEAARQLPYATRVESLTGVRVSFARSGRLRSRPLITEVSDLTPGQLATIKATALMDSMIRNRLVSADGSATGIIVSVALPPASSDATGDPVAEVMAAARELLERMRDAHREIRFGVTGIIAINEAFTTATIGDLTVLVPVMSAILLATMLLLLRSAYGTLATLVVVGLSAGVALGLAGWLGVSLTPPTALAPTIILTIAVADSIHLLVTWGQELRRGATKRAAALESLRINLEPVIVTSITTIIGLLSLNFSDTPPFRELGNITAVGVAAAMVFSLVLLPALMMILPIDIRPGDRPQGASMAALAGFVISQRRKLGLGLALSVAGLAAAIPLLQLNDRLYDYFDESVAVRADTEFAIDSLASACELYWSIDSGEAEGISDPAFLSRVGAFTDWLRDQDKVVHAMAVSDIVRRLNSNMHGDEPEEARIPERRDRIARYLRLFEISLPRGSSLGPLVSRDRAAVRVIATLGRADSRDLRGLDRRSEQVLRDLGLGPSDLRASGPCIMFAYIALRNIRSMLGGTALAFVLISLCLVVALRTFKLGLLSLAPNLLPPVVAFGIWALLVGEVGLAASVVAATSLGVIVDASVHLLSKYLRARRRMGADPEQAIHYAFATAGTAILVSMAILIAGFVVLAFSSFTVNQNLGALTALTMAAALVIDFLLLPCLLLAADRAER